MLAASPSGDVWMSSGKKCPSCSRISALVRRSDDPFTRGNLIKFGRLAVVGNSYNHRQHCSFDQAPPSYYIYTLYYDKCIYISKHVYILNNVFFLSCSNHTFPTLCKPLGVFGWGAPHCSQVLESTNAKFALPYSNPKQIAFIRILP